MRSDNKRLCHHLVETCSTTESIDWQMQETWWCLHSLIQKMKLNQYFKWKKTWMMDRWVDSWMSILLFSKTWPAHPVRGQEGSNCPTLFSQRITVKAWQRLKKQKRNEKNLQDPSKCILLNWKSVPYWKWYTIFIIPSSATSPAPNQGQDSGTISVQSTRPWSNKILIRETKKGINTPRSDTFTGFTGWNGSTLMSFPSGPGVKRNNRT